MRFMINESMETKLQAWIVDDNQGSIVGEL